VRHDLDVHERRRALQLLADAHPADQVAAALRHAIGALAPLPASAPGHFARMRAAARLRYQLLVTWRWFGRAMVLLAAGLATITVVSTVNVVPRLTEVVLLAALAVMFAAALIRTSQRMNRRGTVLLAGALVLTLAAGALRAAVLQSPNLGFFGWAELVSSAVPAVWLLAGVRELRRSRLASYRTFERAILFEILVTQVFAFYHDQFGAVAGLLVDVLILTALRAMIRQEQELLREAGVSVS
jgi:hypothetical protein